MIQIEDCLSEIEIFERHENANMVFYFVRSKEKQRRVKLSGYDDRKLSIAPMLNSDCACLKIANTGDEPMLIPEGIFFQGFGSYVASRLSVVIDQNEISLPVHFVEEGKSCHLAKPKRATHHLSSRWRALNLHRLYDPFREDMLNIIEESEPEVWQEMKKPILFVNDLIVPDSEKRFRAVPCPAQACGLIVALNGYIVAVDLLATSRLFRSMFNPLIYAYEAEAMGAWEYRIKRGNIVSPSYFLQQINRARLNYGEYLGDCKTYRFESNGIVGAALYYRDRLIHLEAFTCEL